MLNRRSFQLPLAPCGFGIRSVPDAGGYRAASKALERARNGEGPTLIEAVTYRMSMHTTADDPTVYRSDDEVEPWKIKRTLEMVREMGAPWIVEYFPWGYIEPAKGLAAVDGP